MDLQCLIGCIYTWALYSLIKWSLLYCSSSNLSHYKDQFENSPAAIRLFKKHSLPTPVISGKKTNFCVSLYVNFLTFSLPVHAQAGPAASGRKGDKASESHFLSYQKDFDCNVFWISPLSVDYAWSNETSSLYISLFTKLILEHDWRGNLHNSYIFSVSWSLLTFCKVMSAYYMNVRLTQSFLWSDLHRWSLYIRNLQL